MNRDIALRLDGMLMAALGNLDRITHYMKDNLTEADYKKYIYHIGNGMAEIAEISNGLHQAHPDIVPKELR